MVQVFFKRIDLKSDFLFLDRLVCQLEPPPPSFRRYAGFNGLLPFISASGWHLTSFGSTDSILFKLDAFSDGVREGVRDRAALNARIRGARNFLRIDEVEWEGGLLGLLTDSYSKIKKIHLPIVKLFFIFFIFD